MNAQPIECVVVDAGARYGLHPSWAEMRGIVRFHLFEMDPSEAARLTAKYAKEPTITVHPLALFSSETEIQFNVSQHRALNSMYQTDTGLLERNEYKTDSFSVVDCGSVRATTIDSVFPNQEIHFLKLDIEGAELEALKGGAEKLRTSVLGVRSEVCFAPVYKDAPVFGDIDRYLRDCGFELLNLDYDGQGNKSGKFTKPGRFGKLISSDAVWVVGNDRLFAGRGSQLREDVVRMALFLMLNGATDLAVETLVRAIRLHGISLSAAGDAPLVTALHRKILLLFKDLMNLPMFEKADLLDTYKLLFDREFPDLNRFYESDMFR